MVQFRIFLAISGPFIGADYDSETNILTFDISIDARVESEPIDLGFDLSLGPIAEISLSKDEGANKAILEGQLMADFTIGLVLTEVGVDRNGVRFQLSDQDGGTRLVKGRKWRRTSFPSQLGVDDVLITVQSGVQYPINFDGATGY